MTEKTEKKVATAAKSKKATKTKEVKKEAKEVKAKPVEAKKGLVGKTTHLKPADLKREWLLVDAQDQTLGRLAAKVAAILIGKHKPTYMPNHDYGDYVVIINADKIKLTGKKLLNKNYYNYSGHIGGMKVTTAGKMMEAHPTRVLETAIKGMLPKNKIGHNAFSKLKLYVGTQHPHESQNPKKVALNK